MKMKLRLILVTTFLLLSMYVASAELQVGYDFTNPSNKVVIDIPEYEENQSLVTVNNSIYWNGNLWDAFRWLNIDGSNANQNIDISPYNITAGYFIGDGSGLRNVAYPHDQELNTTSNVTFDYMILNGDLYMNLNNISDVDKISAYEFHFINGANSSYIKIGDSVFAGSERAIVTAINDPNLAEGEITTLIHAQENNTLLWTQYGKNNSYGGFGNSFGVIPNYMGIENFSSGGVINMTQLSDYTYLCDFFAVDCSYSADTRGGTRQSAGNVTIPGAPLLWSMGDLEIWGSAKIHEGLEVERDIRFIGDGVGDIDFYNDPLHLRLPRQENVTFGIGSIDLFEITWDSVPTGTEPPTPFLDAGSGAGGSTRYWSVRNDPRCFSNPCARAQGANLLARRTIDYNFSTENVTGMNISFWYGSNNMDAGTDDQFNVLVNNYEGSGWVPIYLDNTTASSINPPIFKEFPMPSSMDNKTIVSLRFEHQATFSSEVSFIDNVRVNGTAGTPTVIELTRYDATIELGGSTYTETQCKIQYNDSTGITDYGVGANCDASFPGELTVINITATNMTVEYLNVTEDLYVSNSTIYLGNVSISSFEYADGTKVVTFGDSYVNATGYFGDGGFLDNITFANGTVIAVGFNGTIFQGGDFYGDNFTGGNAYFDTYDFTVEFPFLGFNGSHITFNETRLQEFLEGTYDQDLNTTSAVSFANVTSDFYGTYDWTAEDPWLYFNGTYLVFNESYADERYLGGQLSLYFYNESDITFPSYTIMNTTINPTLQVDTHPNLGLGINLLTKRIFSTAQLSLLQTGAYNQHTTIDFISGTRDVQLQSVLYKRYANGTEIQIGSSPVSSLLQSGVYQQVIWSGAITEETIFNTGDYLVMDLNAVVTSVGSNPTINLVVGGDTAARLDIGLSVNDISITEIDPFSLHLDGSTPMEGNADWGEYNITNITAVFADNFYGTYDWTAETPWFIFNGTYLTFNESYLGIFINQSIGNYSFDNITVSNINVTGGITLNDSTITDWSTFEVNEYTETILINTSVGSSNQSSNLVNFEITQIIVEPATAGNSYRFEAIEQLDGSMIDRDRQVHVGEWNILKGHILNDKVNVSITNAGTDEVFTVTIKYLDNYR